MIKREEYDVHKHFHKKTSGEGKPYPFLLEHIPQGPYSILDFGCGKGGTIEWLKTQRPDAYVEGYDPYIQAYDNPEHFERLWDYTYSGDCLEHIPTQELPGILETLNKITRSKSIHLIDLDPARKVFPNGDNAHLSLLPESEWIRLFEDAGFKIGEYSTQTWNHRRRLELWCYATGNYDTDD